MLPSNNMWGSQSPSQFQVSHHHQSQHHQGLAQVMYSQPQPQPQPLHRQGHPTSDPLAFVYTQNAQSSERELSSFLHGSVGAPPEALHFLGPASSGSFNANQTTGGMQGHPASGSMGPPPTNSGVTLASLIGVQPHYDSPHAQPTNYTFLQQQAPPPMHYRQQQQQQTPTSPPNVVSFQQQQQVVSPTQLMYSQGGNSGSSHFLCVSPHDSTSSIGPYPQQQPQPMHQQQLYAQPGNNAMRIVQGSVAMHAQQQHHSPIQQQQIISPQFFTMQHQQLQSTIPHAVHATPPQPPSYPNTLGHGGSASYVPSCYHGLTSTGQAYPAKKGKRVKKRKAVLTPRSQAAKEKEMQAKEAEKASKGGRPYAEEPVELDASKKQLIVNFVSHAVTETEFAQIFTQFGPISAARIIYDKHTRRSKGYGFVYYKHGEDAIKAIVHLNGMEVHSKLLKVGYASPQRDTPPPSPRIMDEGDEVQDVVDNTDGEDDESDDELEADGAETSDELNEESTVALEN